MSNSGNTTGMLECDITTAIDDGGNATNMNDSGSATPMLECDSLTTIDDSGNTLNYTSGAGGVVESGQIILEIILQISLWIILGMIWRMIILWIILRMIWGMIILQIMLGNIWRLGLFLGGDLAGPMRYPAWLLLAASVCSSLLLAAPGRAGLLLASPGCS